MSSNYYEKLGGGTKRYVTHSSFITPESYKQHTRYYNGSHFFGNLDKNAIEKRYLGIEEGDDLKTAIKKLIYNGETDLVGKYISKIFSDPNVYDWFKEGDELERLKGETDVKAKFGPTLKGMAQGARNAAAKYKRDNKLTDAEYEEHLEAKRAERAAQMTEMKKQTKAELAKFKALPKEEQQRQREKNKAEKKKEKST